MRTAFAPLQGVNLFSGRTQDLRPGLISVALPGLVLFGPMLVLHALAFAGRPSQNRPGNS
jgi:hypothetical protein